MINIGHFKKNTRQLRRDLIISSFSELVLSISFNKSFILLNLPIPHCYIIYLIVYSIKSKSLSSQIY